MAVEEEGLRRLTEEVVEEEEAWRHWKLMQDEKEEEEGLRRLRQVGVEGA